MADYLRLRQICLAAPQLKRVVDDIQTIFRLEVCYRDPNVAPYGLENALIPIGTDFLEVVSPIREDTAAGRFISRTRGHGGYMAIFQANDPRRRQAHAKSLGVRTAHEIEREAYQSAQLHPRDCRAAFIELGHSQGGDEKIGTWWPAGPNWKDYVRTTDTMRMLGISLESPQPAELAAHWSAILETPITQNGTALALRFEDAFIHFLPGSAEVLVSIHIQVHDQAATLERALACGYRVEHNAFHLAGVHFRVSG
jgi:Glyoxalase-like domain